MNNFCLYYYIFFFVRAKFVCPVPDYRIQIQINLTETIHNNLR